MSLSLCMIVRDVAEHLDACLSSVAKYVDEIIIVDTGSKDGTKKVAESFGAKIFDFNPQTHPDAFILDDEKTGAPPPYTGEYILGDFSGARNLSFEKATKDYILWIDSDDVVAGAENLPNLIEDLRKIPRGVGWLRYDYSFDNGKPNCQLWRERIIPRGMGKWVNPIHEVCTFPDGAGFKNFDSVVIEHRRHFDKPHGPKIQHRNYKVLKKLYDKTKYDVDPRTLFYLGNESRGHAPDESIVYYEGYLRLSGWDEERTVARIMLGQLYEMRGDTEAAFKAYSSAHIDFPTNPDPLFALARLAYLKNDWAKCVKLTEQAFALGNPSSPIMYNPLDRTYYPHAYYNVALNHIGRVADARRSCEEGLKVVPTDSNLQYNKKLYEDWLEKNPPAQTPSAGQPTKQLVFESDPLKGTPELPNSLTALLAIQVWKECLRFDEVIKARDLLNALPYTLDEHPQIAVAKAKTEELLAHTRSVDSAKDLHAKSADAVETDIPLSAEIPTFTKQYPRWAFVKRFLEGKKGLRVLDIGCQIGWLSNRVAKLGHSVVGIDFIARHLEIARADAEAAGLDATYVHTTAESLLDVISEKFDVVICTEVLEHVVDTGKLYESIKNVLKDDGAVLFSTPNGAWLQGQPHQYAVPWDHPREHIRAYSVTGLRSELAKYFHVESCYSIPIPLPDVEGQAQLVSVCRRQRARVIAHTDSKNIVIWTGPAWEWWDPTSPHEEGTGGSELACIEMARNFTRLGHHVTVYSDCPKRDGLFDDVTYKHYGAMPSKLECDIFISSRQPLVLLQFDIRAKAKFLWVHDIHVGAPSPQVHSALLMFDRILCLSDWHKAYFCSVYPWLDQSRVVVTRNGINLERFPYPDRARGNRLIYTSSANRGLDALLDVFPDIRKAVPDAELDVFYGFNVWRRAANGNAPELAEIDRLERKLHTTAGVNAHGRVNQQTLAAAWLRAKVWAYPTWFTETSCISAMEAQAAGCIPVTTGLAALNETVKSGILLPPPVDQEYKNKFVTHVVELLTNDELRRMYARRGRTWAETLSWKSLAVEWLDMFDEVTADVAINPMHGYFSCV